MLFFLNGKTWVLKQLLKAFQRRGSFSASPAPEPKTAPLDGMVPRGVHVVPIPKAPKEKWLKILDLGRTISQGGEGERHPLQNGEGNGGVRGNLISNTTTFFFIPAQVCCRVTTSHEENFADSCRVMKKILPSHPIHVKSFLPSHLT